jgi:hypothetical protein
MYYVITKGGGRGSAKCLRLLTRGEGGGQESCLRHHILEKFALRALSVSSFAVNNNSFESEISNFYI